MVLSSVAPSEARRARSSAAAWKPPKPQQQPTREAKVMVLSSAAPSKARRARSSAAARKPPKPPKRKPMREAKASAEQRGGAKAAQAAVAATDARG